MPTFSDLLNKLEAVSGIESALVIGSDWLRLGGFGKPVRNVEALAVLLSGVAHHLAPSAEDNQVHEIAVHLADGSKLLIILLNRVLLCLGIDSTALVSTVAADVFDALR